MVYLVKTTEMYRCDSEDEAKNLIEEAKHGKTFTLTKYNSEIKETKSKGEVIDSWYRVSLTKQFNMEKEPSDMISVSYKYGDYDED